MRSRLLAVVALALASGCGGETGEPALPASPQDDAASARAAATSTSPSTAARLAATLLPLASRPGASEGHGTGIVRGVAAWRGSTPLKIKQLTNDVDVAACGARVVPGSVIAGATGELANVVVELRPASESRRASWTPTEGPPVAVAIERCLQQPHVLLIPVGASVEIENRDGILHELVGLSVRNAPFEAALPRYRRRARIDSSQLARPERIKVACGTHPWAVAWWVVTGTPHHALSGRDGRFEIRGVPVGTWKLLAWHEELGEIERVIDVRSSQPADVELAFR